MLWMQNEYIVDAAFKLLINAGDPDIRHIYIHTNNWNVKNAGSGGY